MASLVPPLLHHVYVIMRLNMTNNVNSIVVSLFCHYGDIDYVFLVGGLVRPDETVMASAICHYRHLVNLRFLQNDRLYMVKVLHGLMDHESFKISIYVTDIRFSKLK